MIKTIADIKLAIQQYYSDREWLVICLKNSWATEGSLASNHRYQLQLNQYATVEITRYGHDSAVVYVYVGVSSRPFRRPEWIDCEIHKDMSYPELRKRVWAVLKQSNQAVDKIRQDYITV